MHEGGLIGNDNSLKERRIQIENTRKKEKDGEGNTKVQEFLLPKRNSLNTLLG